MISDDTEPKRKVMPILGKTCIIGLMIFVLNVGSAALAIWLVLPSILKSHTSALAPLPQRTTGRFPICNPDQAHVQDVINSLQTHTLQAAEKNMKCANGLNNDKKSFQEYLQTTENEKENLRYQQAEEKSKHEGVANTLESEVKAFGTTIQNLEDQIAMLQKQLSSAKLGQQAAQTKLDNKRQAYDEKRSAQDAQLAQSDENIAYTEQKLEEIQGEIGEIKQHLQMSYNTIDDALGSIKSNCKTEEQRQTITRAEKTLNEVLQTKEQL